MSGITLPWRPGLARELVGALFCGLLNEGHRMAVFIAAADESSAGNHDGTFIFGGLIAPEPDWRDYFAPAWQDRVLNGPPSIPFLHMTDIRRPEWRANYHLSDIEADRRIDEAFRVVQSMGSLWLVTSRLNENVFRKVFSKSKIQSPKKRAFPMKPDFICFIAFATCVLEYVNAQFPGTEKVDFVVERNNKITEHIKQFHAVLDDLLDPSLLDIKGDLISAGKERVPLQAADVVCWHDRKVEDGTASPLDKTRHGILARKLGYRHEWTNDELMKRLAKLANSRSSFPEPGPSD